MRISIVAALFTLGSASGCASPQPINIMNEPAQCDSVPPPLAPGEPTGGALPRDLAAHAGAATVIGVVLESGSRRPLWGATVALRPTVTLSGSDTTTRRVITGRDGAFAFPAVALTSYELRALLIGHSPRSRTLTPRANAVDTVLIEMPYLHCVGY